MCTICNLLMTSEMLLLLSSLLSLLLLALLFTVCNCPTTRTITVARFRSLVLSSHQLTVGKVYCVKLIYENYKNRKRKQELETLNRGRKKVMH